MCYYLLESAGGPHETTDAATIAAKMLTLASLAGYRSVTVPSQRVGGSPLIPLSDARAAPRPNGEVEQVHLTGASASSMHVTYVTNDSKASGLVKSVVHLSVAGSGQWTDVTDGYGDVYSFVESPAPWQVPKPDCDPVHNYTNPDCFYTSGAIHSVELTGLTPSTTYQYRCAGDGRTFNFSTPPNAGARSVRFGVVGDLGQTENSTETLNGLGQAGLDAVLFAGDLS